MIHRVPGEPLETPGTPLSGNTHVRKEPVR
jgi:hypothetical protein